MFLKSLFSSLFVTESMPKKAKRGMRIVVYFSFSVSYELIGFIASPVHHQSSVTPLSSKPVDQ